MLWKRLIFLLTPLLLAGCLLTPGKFTSTLTIHADRSFAFTYRGEVIAIDPSSAMGALTPAADGKAADAETAAGKAKASAELETKRRAIADALAKEEGYRSVKYVGNGKYLIDYAISGRLDHGFVYPFNIDGEAVFPFLAVELRKDGAVRIMAPGFSSQNKAPGMDAMPDAGGGNAALDGSFTLTTDAEVVMHNSEDGVKPAGATRSITWRATPLTKIAPTAVLRLKP